MLDRAQKDLLEHESTTEHSVLEASLVALQRKAKIYEKLATEAQIGDDSSDDGHETKDEDVLVDFTAKDSVFKDSASFIDVIAISNHRI